MARNAVGPRRTDSLRTYVRATRIIGGLSVLVLFGAIAWDLMNDGFWSRHTLFASLVASLIVVAVTAAVLNEVLERRHRELSRSIEARSNSRCGSSRPTGGLRSCLTDRRRLKICRPKRLSELGPYSLS